MYRRSDLEIRVLILAPIGRDAALLANTLDTQAIPPAIARDADALLQMLAEGAGCAIVAEEALTADAIRALEPWLSAQPPWSDMPLVVLTSGGLPTRQSRDKAHELQALGNFTL